MSNPTASQIEYSLTIVRKQKAAAPATNYRELQPGDRVRQGDGHFVDGIARQIPFTYYGRPVVKERTIYRPVAT